MILYMFHNWAYLQIFFLDLSYVFLFKNTISNVPFSDNDIKVHWLHIQMSKSYRFTSFSDNLISDVGACVILYSTIFFIKYKKYHIVGKLQYKEQCHVFWRFWQSFRKSILIFELTVILFKQYTITLMFVMD